jgi:hypothetical protein
VALGDHVVLVDRLEGLLAVRDERARVKRAKRSIAMRALLRSLVRGGSDQASSGDARPLRSM